MENKKPRWRTGLIIALAFAIGYVAGVATPFSLWYLGMRGGFSMGDPGRVANMLAKRLDLTKEQKGKVETIVTQTRKDLYDLRDEVVPKIEAVFNQARDQVAALLDEGQKKKFDRFVEERLARYRRMRQRFARMRER
jgi:Spy/CpxP family protein refolding chaperone